MNDSKIYKKWIEHINNFRIPVYNLVEKEINFQGQILEIGAGTCWLSSLISNKGKVKKIVAVDNDSSKLLLAKNYFIPEFNGKLEKIILKQADFHKLDYPNSVFDFVICDAALHHSEKLSKLLKELKRVMKKDGKLIAIREPVLPSVPGLSKIKKFTFGWRQKRKGDIEKAYLIQDWKRSFEKNGMTLERKKYSLDTTNKELFLGKISFLNGILFNRSYFIAYKKY